MTRRIAIYHAEPGRPGLSAEHIERLRAQVPAIERTLRQGYGVVDVDSGFDPMVGERFSVSLWRGATLIAGTLGESETWGADLWSGIPGESEELETFESDIPTVAIDPDAIARFIDAALRSSQSILAELDRQGWEGWDEAHV
jgi:hypothetical protein